MNEKEIDEVLKQVKIKGFVEFSNIDGLSYIFKIQGKTELWELNFDFNGKRFPYELPQISLLNKEFIGKIPHVDIQGTICLVENEGLLINSYDPVGIINHLLNDSVNSIERWKLKIFQDELEEEIEGYFQSESSEIHSFYKPEDSFEELYLEVYKDKKKGCIPLLLHSKKGKLPTAFSNLKDLNKYQRLNIFHLPLDRVKLPPKNGEKISSEYLMDIYKYINKKNIKEIKNKLVHGKYRSEFFLLMSMPRKNNEKTQLLLKFKSNSKMINPLLNLKNKWDIRLYLLNRNNKEYLLERGGANNSLLNKKVSIVGCGSVGSEIALMLAKAGIGTITLIDFDSLNSDNIYRHRLGGESLDFTLFSDKSPIYKKNKTTLLKEFIERSLPYITVNNIPYSFMNAVDDEKVEESDIVIIAVGSPTKSLEFNKELKSKNINNVIYCWNEAGGIGGHSAIFDLDSSCYECLYSNDSGFVMKCELDFLDPGQDISKNLTGCAGVFTPFSYYDSIQTASLATKQCIDYFENNKNSYALSWKGDNNEKLRVTEKYMKSSLKDITYINKKNGCRVCNAKII